MIELVLVYCLASNPGVCMEQRPAPEQPLSLMACMIAGPRLGAAFVADHRQWTLSRWRCGAGMPREAHA